MRYCAFLRSVNVAGNNVLPMAHLRSALADAGFAAVHTVLQSGNVVFESSKRSRVAIEAAVESAISVATGLSTPVTVRSDDELAEAIARNPFADTASRDPARLLAFMLKTTPEPAAVESLRAAIRGPEQVALDGDVLFVVFPDGIGRSKLTTALIDRHLQTMATGRNWNTMQRVLAATRN